VLRQGGEVFLEIGWIKAMRWFYAEATFPAPM